MQIDKPEASVIAEFKEAVWGKEEKPRAIFKTHMMLDVTASQEAGRRIERPTPYMALKFPGNPKSLMFRRASAADIAKYAEAFAAYQEEIRNGNEAVYEGWEDVRTDTDRRTQQHQPGSEVTIPIGAAFSRRRAEAGGTQAGQEESKQEESKQEDCRLVI